MIVEKLEVAHLVVRYVFGRPQDFAPVICHLKPWEMTHRTAAIDAGSNDALVDVLQNLKRTRDGESEDAPQPKRDKLFNELLEMEGTFGEDTSDIATLAASAPWAAGTL